MAPERLGVAVRNCTPPVPFGARKNVPVLATSVDGTPVGRAPVKPVTLPKASVAVIVPSR